MLIRYPLSRLRRWLRLLPLLAALPPLPADRPGRQIPDLSGCRSVQGDAWFVDELSFEPLAIAPGVLVEPLGEGLRLSNATDTPLYLVEVFSDSWPNAPIPISLTAPLGVRHRVLAGEAAHWRFADRTSAPQWQTDLGVSTLDYASILPDSWLPDYKQERHHADGRPANAAPPPDATYTLRVIYGDELFAIPVTQTYRLNPTYDPNRERDERERCNSRGPSLIGLVVLCVGLPAGVMLMLSLLVVFQSDRRYG